MPFPSDGNQVQLKAIHRSTTIDAVSVLQFFICRDEQCFVCRSRESTDPMYPAQALLFTELDETLFDSGAVRNILKLAQLLRNGTSGVFCGCTNSEVALIPRTCFIGFLHFLFASPSASVTH